MKEIENNKNRLNKADIERIDIGVLNFTIENPNKSEASQLTITLSKIKKNIVFIFVILFIIFFYYVYTFVTIK